MPTFFTATVQIIGVNPYVTPPEPVLQSIFAQAHKDRGPIPVCGQLNKKAFIQTLVKYAGAWRLYLNGPMRQATGLQVGDQATVTLAYDPKPRDVPMPELFKQVLNANPDAKAAFKKFPPSHQREILRYLNNIKTQETLVINIERVMQQLQGKSTDKLRFFERPGHIRGRGVRL